LPLHATTRTNGRDARLRVMRFIGTQ
jgi:hypothetical protein